MSQRQNTPTLMRFHMTDEAGSGAPEASLNASTVNESPLFRLDFGRSLWMHRKLAMSILVAALLCAIGMGVRMWPVYKATSQVYVQPAAPSLLGQGNVNRWPYDTNSYDSYVQEQIQTATNPNVLLGALKQLDPSAWMQEGESEQAAVLRLESALKVARVSTSYEIEITAQTGSPGLSALIANAVAQGLVEKSANEANAGNLKRLEILKEERDRLQKELDEDRGEQLALNRQLGMASVSSNAPDLIDNEIEKTREELIRARAAHDEADSRFSAMSVVRGNSTGVSAQAADQVSADPGMTSLKTSLNIRRAQLISQMANLTSENPAYKIYAEELDKINSSLNSMSSDLHSMASDRILRLLRADLERTAGVEERLNRQLRQLTGAAASATPKLQRNNDLAIDIQRMQARYAIVDDQIRNLTLQKNSPGSVHISVQAYPALHPSYGSLLRVTLPVLFAGLFFALAAALLANNLDGRVYIAADLVRELGVAPMAVLPHFSEVSKGVAEEHVLRLTAGIEFARQQGYLKSCIFTGIAPGAGVSTLTSRVRSVLESMGRSTVLMDASGTAPKQSESAPGTDGEPSAPRASRSTALVRQVARESETQEESLVLTDTAPLSVAAETEYLSRFVDAAIVVVESGVTTRQELREISDRLQRLDVAAVGFVLNKVSLGKADASFRKSIKDIERHLQVQGRSDSRSSELGSLGLNLQTEMPRATAEPKAAPAQAPYADPGMQPVAPQQAPVDSMRSSSGFPPLPSAPARETQPAPKQPAPDAPAVPLHNGTIPIDSGGRDPKTPPPISPSALESAIHPPAVGPSTPPKPPSWAESWKPFTASDAILDSSRPKASAPATPYGRPAPDSQAGGRSAVPPLPVKPPAHPAASPAASPAVAPPAVPPLSSAPVAPASTPLDAATRMTGLRNLIFSLGNKPMPQADESARPAAPLQPAKASAMPAAEPAKSSPIKPAVPAESPLFSSARDLPRAEAPSAAPANPATLVTAVPEILPPKPEPTPESDRKRTMNTATRISNRESVEDFDTLPSWRGQYRKKT